MTENPLARFDRATALLDEVIAEAGPDQFALPTPCSEWSVRQLVNHLVAGNLNFVSRMTGGPGPDWNHDHLGDDPLAAFRDTNAALRTEFSGEGVLARTYPTPFGEGPGSMLVTMRVVEMTVHAWDLAKAIGRSTDLDPELSEFGLRALRQGLPEDRSTTPFGAEQSVPEGATAADRLAAFSGRTVG